MLTVDALRNGAATTRALLPGGNSPAPVDEPQKPLVSLAQGSDEAADLLDDLLIALLDLPGDGWSDIMLAVPDEIFDRCERYLETWLSEGACSSTIPSLATTRQNVQSRWRWRCGRQPTN